VEIQAAERRGTFPHGFSERRLRQGKHVERVEARIAQRHQPHVARPAQFEALDEPGPVVVLGAQQRVQRLRVSKQEISAEERLPVAPGGVSAHGETVFDEVAAQPLEGPRFARRRRGGP